MSPPDFYLLEDAPQLAILAALDDLIEHVVNALIAAHPEILGHDFPGDAPSVWLAEIVNSEGRRLQILLRHYRAALEQDLEPRSHRLAPID